MSRSTLLCQKVIEITEDYLGPSAPRFIDRLASSHLGKDASRLSRNDMEELVRWARLAAAMLTDDTGLVAEYTQRLEALSKVKPAGLVSGRQSR